MADADKQPNDAEPAAPDEPQHREVSKENLKRILADHAKWIETDGREGSKAVLVETNLQKADLSSANFQKANL